MSTVEIRFLTADDAPSLWELRLEALQLEVEAFGSSVEDHLRLTVEDFRTRLSSDPANYLVIGVFDGGKLAGSGWFMREGRLKELHKGRIQGIYLSPILRGQGIGRRMLEALLERAVRIDGVEQITLSVVCTQPAALALYRSLGFVTYGHEVNALKVNGRYLDEEHMVLRLGKTRTEPSRQQ